MLAHMRYNLRRRLRVKSHHRLVKHPQLRLVNERRDYANLLLHSVRIGFNLLVYRVFKTEQFCKSVHTLGAYIGRNLVEGRNVVYVLSSRKLLANGMVIGNVAHMHLCFYRLLLNVIAADFNSAAVKGQNARKTFYSSGFTRAVLSEKSENLAGAQLKRYIVDSNPVAFWIRLYKMTYFKHKKLLL